jgi:hypothetical protein
MANLVCRIFGVVFLIVAVWGFVDGHSVLIFHVNTAHNVVHLVSGLAALGCGFANSAAARAFCLVFGAVYGLVAILGFLNVQAVNELLHLNDADDVLHAVIAAVFLAAPFLPWPRSTPHSGNLPA